MASAPPVPASRRPQHTPAAGQPAPAPGRSRQPLAGRWLIAPDHRDEGRSAAWQAIGPTPEARETPIPGIIQQVFPGYHGVAWYWHTFTPERAPDARQRALLRFGAVDYLADVWLNGRHVGGHEGGETPFQLDATAALRAGQENLLALRVLNPTDEPIDGIRLAETPKRTKRMEPLHPPIRMNHGGMMGAVDLLVVPEVRLDDLCVRPNPATGEVALLVTLENATSQPRAVRLDASIAAAATSGGGGAAPEAVTAREVTAPPGISEQTLTLSVSHPRLWQLEDPFLYRAVGRLTGSAPDGAAFADEQAVRCGFRDFRLVGGFFHLNGKRVFLRSSHTGNHAPVGQQLSPPGSDVLLRDMLFAKTSGFNCLRFIAGMPRPEQLDLADELGLMVYEENCAAWLMGESPSMAERWNRSTREMILRDRNHPCVVMWGLLNETRDGPVFRNAVAFLPELRAIDPTRLVLLNSGRFDNDFGMGSASNPGRPGWEHVWGAEAPGVPPRRRRCTIRRCQAPATSTPTRACRRRSRMRRCCARSARGPSRSSSLSTASAACPTWSPRRARTSRSARDPTWATPRSSAPWRRSWAPSGGATAWTASTHSWRTSCWRASACTPAGGAAASTWCAPTPICAAST